MQNKPEDMLKGRKADDTPKPVTTTTGLQRGLQGMYEGTGEDAEDAFASLERELGIAEA